MFITLSAEKMKIEFAKKTKKTKAGVLRSLYRCRRDTYIKKKKQKQKTKTRKHGTQTNDSYES